MFNEFEKEFGKEEIINKINELIQILKDENTSSISLEEFLTKESVKKEV